MMTEATAPAMDAGPAQYIQIWADSFCQVLGQITGSAVPCAVGADMSPELPGGGEKDVWVMVTASGGLRGEMTLRLGAQTALRLAQTFMSEPVTPEAELTADYRDAVVELLRQVAGIVSSSAKARWGEVQLRAELAVGAPSWPSAGTFWMRAGEEGPTGMVLEFGLSASLVAELRTEKEKEKEKIAAEKTVAERSASVPAADSEPGTGALGLLMDVQLTMTMRFGSRQLLLREVLDLSPGAVVELDRRIEEPVDLLLDGRLVARGEVVVIDGNYGLRVTDVSPLGLPEGAA